MTGVLASFRYLLADVIGIDDTPPPVVPDDWPEAVKPVAREAVTRNSMYIASAGSCGGAG
jgi:hypothetical protein